MAEHQDKLGKITNDSRRPRWGARATLALVILALFIVQRKADIAPIEEVAEHDNFVDTYTVDISSQQFNDKGVRTRLLESDYAAHYALSDESILQSPKIRSISSSGKVWETRARNGKVRPGGEVYDLWNTVFVERIGGDAVARTDSLTYFSMIGEASTEEEVVIDTNIGQTIGVGMTANLNTEILQLHSEVRSVFEPIR